MVCSHVNDPKELAGDGAGGMMNRTTDLRTYRDIVQENSTSRIVLPCSHSQRRTEGGPRSSGSTWSRHSQPAKNKRPSPQPLWHPIIRRVPAIRSAQRRQSPESVQAPSASLTAVVAWASPFSTASKLSRTCSVSLLVRISSVTSSSR